MTTALTILACVIFCIVNGEIDARKIKKNKKVNHEANAGLYLALVIVLSFLTDWKLGIGLLCVRPLVFDQYLNVRRGLPFNYQPLKPDSVVDRMENKLFGHKHAWLVSNLIYLTGLAVSIIIYEK